MTDVEIRPITPGDDFDAQLDLGQRAFGVYPAEHRASWLHAARLRAGQGLFLGAFIGATPVGAAILPVVPARAQTYPSRPVRVIVGFPAGNSPDIITRLTCHYLSDHLGQQFVASLLPLFGGHYGGLVHGPIIRLFDRQGQLLLQGVLVSLLSGVLALLSSFEQRVITTSIPWVW